MIPFAVTVEGVTKPGQAYWVLGIDPGGERLLVVHEDQSFHWHPIAACSFAKLVQPDAPQPVIPVQVQSQEFVLPNRAQRRQFGRDGGG